MPCVRLHLPTALTVYLDGTSRRLYFPSGKRPSEQSVPLRLYLPSETSPFQQSVPWLRLYIPSKNMPSAQSVPTSPTVISPPPNHRQGNCPTGRLKTVTPDQPAEPPSVISRWRAQCASQARIWIRSNVALSWHGHTNQKAPDPVRSRKLTWFGRD